MQVGYGATQQKTFPVMKCLICNCYVLEFRVFGGNILERKGKAVPLHTMVAKAGEDL